MCYLLLKKNLENLNLKKKKLEVPQRNFKVENALKLSMCFINFKVREVVNLIWCLEFLIYLINFKNFQIRKALKLMNLNKTLVQSTTGFCFIAKRFVKIMLRSLVNQHNSCNYIMH